MTRLNTVAEAETERVPASPTESGRVFAWISILMFGSGFAALIYEVVWLQQMELIIGSSAISLGLLLATYMGGLLLGSIASERLISASHHPLRIYSVLELGTAALGILILSGLPYVGSFYIRTSAFQVYPSLLLRGTLCAACLLPPTILMGSTFPVVSRWLEPTKPGVSRMGFLYGANIAGAVFGCLWAGFYLLRVYDLALATYVAVATNIVTALAGFGLAARYGSHSSIRAVCKGREPVVRETAIYLAIGLSGFSALGAQVVWTRMLSVLFGTTVYSFSIILAVFLAGVGIGSGIGSILACWTNRARLIFGICQMTLAVSIAWTAWTLAKSLPYWPIDPSVAASPWFNFQLDLVRAVWAILPATVLWGASFPLALASLASPDRDSGWLAARTYAANTLGAIVGALTFSFVAIPRTGTTHSEQILIGVPCLAALCALASLFLGSSGQLSSESVPAWQRGAILAFSVLLVVSLIATVSEIPWQMIAYGRRIALMMYSDRLQSKTDPIRLLYRGEGLDSSAVITEQSGLRILYVNGNVEASNAVDDMRLERMAGHLPALVHTNPRDVLIVGFGAGITAGSFVVHPEAKRIVIVELESLIPPASGTFFRQENYGVSGDERTMIVHDDGRHYLVTHQDSFDVITSDPVHLWVKGTSALYSKEYFEIVRRHLKPGGVIAQWLPLYDGDAETVKSVMATFFEVFRDGTVWSNHTGDRGYDLVLLGQDSPTRINVDELQQRLNRPDHSAVADSLRAVGFKSASDLLATYLGQAPDLKPWLTGAQINLDRNLRLQYLSGLTMNSRVSEEIYHSLLAYRRFPESLFNGSDEALRPLRALLKPSETIPER